MGSLDERRVDRGLLAMQHNIDPRYKAAANSQVAGLLRRLAKSFTPQNIAQLGLEMLPGSGDYAAARDSAQMGQEMVDRFKSGDYGGAATSGLLSLAAGAGALPMIPNLVGAIKAVRGGTALPNLREMDVSEGTEIARKEPHLISSSDRADGKYIGGPRNVKSKRDLTNLRNQFDAYVAADPRGGDWYDRYRSSVSEVTGGSPRDAEWMSKMEGQWSAGVSPEGELGFALKENNAALAGRPTKAARPAQHEAFMRAVHQNDINELQLGKKTGEYARRIDPSQPRPASATGVNDFRHARNFDYTEAAGGSQRDALTDAQHRFLDYETALAVDRANNANLGGRSDWTGEQLQAAPWVRQKAEAILEQRPAILEKYRALGLPEQDAYLLAYEDAFNEATKTIGEHFPKHTAYATHESMVGPNTGHMPGSVNATQAEREAFAADPRSTWAMSDVSARGTD